VTPPDDTPAYCAACGSGLVPGTRFCTSCGATVAAAAPPEPAAAPPPPPAAPPPPDPPAAPSAPAPPPDRFVLGTPTANERWRNPIVIAAAVASVLLGGGVASWRFFLTASEAPSVVQRLAPLASDPPEAAATTPEAADVPESVQAIDSVLRRSARGRDAALLQRDYGAALRNRRQLLARLDQIAVPEQPQRLAQAYATLRAALEASARADVQHRACGCDEVQPGDVTATRLKRRFVVQFNPYAQRYLGHSIDPDRI